MGVDAKDAPTRRPRHRRGPPGGLLPVGTVATPAGAVTVGQVAGRRLAAMINGPSLPSRSESTNGMPVYAFARH